MYAFTDSAEGDCYLSVTPDPGIEAAALGASASAAPGTGESAAPGAGESALSGTAPTEDLHTFTLDSGASRSFFRDSTTLTLLSPPVAVSLADPSGGPVLAHSSTVLPCPAAPSGLLSLTTASPPVTASGQVAASSQVFAAAFRSRPESAHCSCRPLSHETLLWHHHLGHPSLPRLRGMASRTLVSGLPRSLPPVPPGPVPTCVQCVEGRQRAAPHSSTFPLTEAPLQTLHMDVCGPAAKGDVTEVLIDWISGARRQLSERFSSHLPVLRLHSDRGGEFSSDLLRAFCRTEGIRQTFTLWASLQRNGIADRRIGMVMDVARTSMIHAAAPHFLWPFAVQYAAHQINLQSRVSLPETTPTLRWTGKVGDASSGGVEPGGAEPERVEPKGTASGGSKIARPESGGALGVPLRREPLSPQQLREWYTRRCRGAAGAAAAGGAAGAARGATGAGAAGGATGAGAAGGAAGVGAAGATGGAAGGAGGAAGAGAAEAAGYTSVVGGHGGARTVATRAAGTGGAA
ncbi:unnamed protein product [Closterium sp. NIES-54]